MACVLQDEQPNHPPPHCDTHFDVYVSGARFLQSGAGAWLIFAWRRAKLQSRDLLSIQRLFLGIYHYMCPRVQTHRSLGTPGSGWPALRAVITLRSRLNQRQRAAVVVEEEEEIPY
ncbi:unnamed protein product [Pleuronectes platessa]|uniref:Uncharacterized protein n=1 Tax=Pleuronectes platessa TaxID=8262 RepID=A0A9N7Z5R8_PLEPL|nr:unnamed protein product [Pleuronectes platessa]